MQGWPLQSVSSWLLRRPKRALWAWLWFESGGGNECSKPTPWADAVGSCINYGVEQGCLEGFPETQVAGKVGVTPPVFGHSGLLGQLLDRVWQQLWPTDKLC